MSNYHQANTRKNVHDETVICLFEMTRSLMIEVKCGKFEVMKPIVIDYSVQVSSNYDDNTYMFCYISVSKQCNEAFHDCRVSSASI